MPQLSGILRLHLWWKLRPLNREFNRLAILCDTKGETDLAAAVRMLWKMRFEGRSLGKAAPAIAEACPRKFIPEH